MIYIITGTSSGLGYCLAERLIEYGQVIGISRSIGTARVLCQSISYKHVQFDFSESSNSDKFNILIDILRGCINNNPFTLILNAACFYSGANRLTDSLSSRLFETNFFSLVRIINAVGDLMLRRVFIVNSISGLIGQCDQHEYSASKHAVMGFSRSLAKSAKNSEYDVMCINPGGMRTELWRNYESLDTSDFLSPEAVADICKVLILIPQRAFIENMIILPPSDV